MAATVFNDKKRKRQQQQPQAQQQGVNAWSRSPYPQGRRGGALLSVMSKKGLEGINEGCLGYCWGVDRPAADLYSAASCCASGDA